MPRKFFLCPDGEQIEIKQCLEKCRMAARCATKPYLKLAGEWRPWSGKASVTRLDRCLRGMWLEVRNDFGDAPDNHAFRIIGTRAHGKLEELAVNEEYKETFMEVDAIRGMLDLVEKEGDEYIMTDYKVVGAYSIKKLTGLGPTGQKDILDKDGNPVLYVRGPKKGTPKTETVNEFRADKAEYSGYDRQLNLYKIAWELLKKPLIINRLQIFAIARDGGLYTTKQGGVTRNTYMVPIPILDKVPLLKWARERGAEINEAMAQEILPPIGTPEQCWDGRFCQGYCSVREFCEKCGDNPWLGGRVENETIEN